MNATPPPRIELRRALAADVAALERLAAECELHVDFPRELARSYGLLLVALRDGEPSGFLLAWRAADELHLTDLGVTAPARRGGLARALVGELAREGRKSAAACILLEVRAGNAAALALYRSLGFGELDRRPRYYSDNDEDAVVMQLRLR